MGFLFLVLRLHYLPAPEPLRQGTTMLVKTREQVQRNILDLKHQEKTISLLYQFVIPQKIHGLLLHVFNDRLMSFSVSAPYFCKFLARATGQPLITKGL